MHAATIAQSLKDRGFAIKSTQEGTAEADGMVALSELVHVQVSTYGSSVSVVAQTASGESLQFYPARDASDIDGLASDIGKAMAGTTEKAPAASKYEELDEAIKIHIKTTHEKHPVHSQNLLNIAASNLGRDMYRGDDKEWRLIDRRLQLLKKAGQIEYSRKLSRWTLVPA